MQVCAHLFGERRRPLLSWRNRFVGCSVQRAAGAAARAALLARRLVVMLEGRLSGYDAGLVACEAARDARSAACRAAVEVLRCRVAGEGGAMRHKRRRAACSRQGGAAGERCGGGSRQGAARGGARVFPAGLWCCGQRTRLSGGGCDVPYRWAAPRPKQASSAVENLTKREKTTWGYSVPTRRLLRRHICVCGVLELQALWPGCESAWPLTYAKNINPA